MSYESFIKQTVPKIIGIGMNYLHHVKEMGGKQLPTEPVIFIKPWTSVNYNPSTLSLPISL